MFSLLTIQLRTMAIVQPTPNRMTMGSAHSHRYSQLYPLINRDSTLWTLLKYSNLSTSFFLFSCPFPFLKKVLTEAIPYCSTTMLVCPTADAFR